MKHGVDSLQSRQPRRCGRTGLQCIEALGHARHVLDLRRDVLRVKATLGISEFVGVDAVTDAKAPNTRSSGDDNARPVGSEDERKLRTPGRPPGSVANRGVP